MVFKNGLFSFPTYVWKYVSLGIFPLPFFVSEDFVKPARGFNMKDKGLFVLYSPSEMTISVNIWIRSTSYRVLMKMHLGLGRFLVVYVKQQTVEMSGNCRGAVPGFSCQFPSQETVFQAGKPSPAGGNDFLSTKQNLVKLLSQ